MLGQRMLCSEGAHSLPGFPWTPYLFQCFKFQVASSSIEHLEEYLYIPLENMWMLGLPETDSL